MLMLMLHSYEMLFTPYINGLSLCAIGCSLRKNLVGLSGTDCLIVSVVTCYDRCHLSRALT